MTPQSFSTLSIHDFDEERRRRRSEPTATIVGRLDLSIEARLRLAMGILAHNQAFVTFTDQKANSLLLLNSIFLATAASAVTTSFGALAAVGAAAAAALLCLGVIWARMPGLRQGSKARMLFFADILKRRNAATFVEDLRDVGPEELFDGTAVQVYELAAVVDRKFRTYRWAQTATLLSAGLWIGQFLMPLPGQ